MTVSAPVLELQSLAKRYGSLAAVAGINLTVSPGEVLGLLGPNGSGKSTTLNMVLGFVRPTSGRILINGHELRRDTRAALASVGGLVEGSAFYPYLSGRRNLQILARLHRLPDARVEEVLAMMDLAHAADRQFGAYSQGMRQRLGVAGALIHHPRLIVLDEPTSGLDPAGTREMRALLPRVATEGTAVVLASHLLTEVEQVCDRVAIMKRGTIIATGGVQTLLHRELRWRVRVETTALPRAGAIVQALPGTRSVEVREGDLWIATDVTGDVLNRALMEQGIIASEIEPETPNLEAVFMEMTEQAS